MSIDYFITNLLNIKDNNITFLDGIHHKVIKGVKYSVINAKLKYSNQPCPHCSCNDKSLIIKYGFKLSHVKYSKVGDYPLIIDLKKQKMFCKNCNHYFLVSSNIVKKIAVFLSMLKSLF